MRKSRFTERQIVVVLKQAEEGVPEQDQLRRGHTTLSLAKNEDNLFLGKLRVVSGISPSLIHGEIPIIHNPVFGALVQLASANVKTRVVSRR